MGSEIQKWLFDAYCAAKHIHTFVEGNGLYDYRTDRLLSSAEERQFEIIGEAFRRIRDNDEEFLQEIEGWRGAISFRNILSHGYDHIENDLVWGIIEDDLPVLMQCLEKYI